MDDAYCEALAEAYRFEQEGFSFYSAARDRIADPFARKALEFLIIEEQHHLDKIARFNDWLLGAGSFDLETECAVGVPERMIELIGEVREGVEKSLDDAAGDIEVYEAAMEFERRGFAFYTDERQQTDDERLHRFFDFLIAEEAAHYNLLANSKKYLEDPSYYFEDAGGWIFV